MATFKGSYTTEDDKWTMQFDFNSMARFEELTGKKAQTVLEAYGNSNAENEVSIIDLRALVYASLKRHHPEATLDDAGDVLNEYPEAFQNTFLAAMPDAAEESAGNGKKGRATKTRV